MSQYVLSPDEAKTLRAIPDLGETTLIQAAVDARSLLPAIRKAVEGLIEKQLAKRTTGDGVALLPAGQRVRGLIKRYNPAPGTAVRSDGRPDWWNPIRWLFPSPPVDRVLILPEQTEEDAPNPALSSEQLDQAIDDELARQKAAAVNDASPQR